MASFLVDRSDSSNKSENALVPRRLEQLELACRYSVVYELARIDHMLNIPTSLLAADLDERWTRMSISA